MKKKMGTRMILLVPFRKSADASITSMASLREVKFRQMQHRKERAMMPTVMQAISI